MWIVTRYGFYAVAQNRKDTKTVIVRARVRNDLERFRTFLPKNNTYKITYHEAYDYPYRLIISKVDYVDVVTQMASRVDYDNFKSLISKLYGHARHMVYMHVWSALKKLEFNPKREDKYWDRQMAPYYREQKHQHHGTRYSDAQTTLPFKPLPQITSRAVAAHAMVVHSDD